MSDNLTILDGADASKIIATKEVSSVHHQVVVPYGKSRSDTFTVAASGTVVDVSAIPCARFALQVTGTGGAASAWSVVLEGSLDGVAYTTIVTHASADGDANGATKWQALPAGVKYFKSHCVSVTLGGASDIVAAILGQAAQ